MLETPACLKREFHLTHLCGMNELTVALICTFQRYLPFWCQYFICWPFVFLARILFISFTFIQYMSWNHLRLPQSASEWIITKNIKRREIWKLQFQFFRYISWNNLRLPQNASEWIITKNVLKAKRNMNLKTSIPSWGSIPNLFIRIFEKVFKTLLWRGKYDKSVASGLWLITTLTINGYK